MLGALIGMAKSEDQSLKDDGGHNAAGADLRGVRRLYAWMDEKAKK